MRKRPSRGVPGQVRGSGLGRAGEPLFLAGSLDDHVTIAEAQHGARVALLFPELRDLLLELLMLGLERRVESLGQRAHDLDPAIRQAVYLLLDLVQRSHTSPNAGRETAIPGLQEA